MNCNGMQHLRGMAELLLGRARTAIRAVGLYSRRTAAPRAGIAVSSSGDDPARDRHGTEVAMARRSDVAEVRPAPSPAVQVMIENAPLVSAAREFLTLGSKPQF